MFERMRIVNSIRNILQFRNHLAARTDGCYPKSLPVSMSRFVISIVLSALGVLTGFGAQLNAQIGPTSVSGSLPHAPGSEDVSSASLKLNLSVISGRDGSNILRPPSAVPPTVEIRDANNQPVTGAVVTFTAPQDAPTVKFPNGMSSYSVVTNGSGQASVTDMAP